jgi:hypothetical protein
MAASTTFIFDASPLIASCQFAVGKRSVADIALSGATVQIPPAVYEEVITRDGTRPDALKAARSGCHPTLPCGIRPAFTRDVEETQSMSMVTIRVPEELEQVLVSVLNRDPDKGAEWLKAGFEARLAELYQQWQSLRISTARFAELMGVSPWELADLLHDRGLKGTNLPG